MAVPMVITIVNFWKLFHYRVRIDHYDKLIGIGESLELICLDYFNSSFKLTPVLRQKILFLDEVNKREIVSPLHYIRFSSYVFCSTQGRTIYELYLNSAPSPACTL